MELGHGVDSLSVALSRWRYVTLLPTPCSVLPVLESILPLPDVGVKGAEGSLGIDENRAPVIVEWCPADGQLRCP
jgi:hypothetical protein